MIYKINLISKSITNYITTTDITSKVMSGFSSHEKLDESLDVGSITINNLTKSTPYTMFDSIEVLIDDEVIFSQRIAGDKVQLVSKNPKLYRHNITLVEHTKMLELFIISGKTFTQPTNGDTLYTLADVVTILNNTTPLELEEIVEDTRVFVWNSGSEYYDLFDSYKSPEFTFKDQTLREALNEVGSYLSAIPRLYMNEEQKLELTFDFVNDLKTLIASEDDFIEKSLQQDIEFYATQMESDAYNLVNDTDVNESVETYPSDGTYTTARSSEYIFDYLKSYIPTPKRIYDATIKMKAKNIEVKLGATTIYNSEVKYDYYDTYNDFALGVGKENIIYVDMSNSNACYLYDGSWNSTATTTNVFPKIRYVDTYSNFSSTGTIVDQFDLFIAKDTKKVYRWQTTFIEVTNIDYDGYIIMDLSDRVLEYNLYSQLDFDVSVKANKENRYDPEYYYQTNTIYYNYREQNIPLGTTIGFWDTKTSIKAIVQIKTFEELQLNGFIASGEVFSDYSTTFNDTTPENDFMYQVNYTAIPSSVRINIDRQDLSDINMNSMIQSNQISRVVNLESYTNNRQATINRIGNSELQLDIRTTDISTLNVIGDYTEDLYIVTERELIFNVDYIYCKLLLSKNYNMISKFIGLNSEIRQWEIGEQNTLERKIMYSEYVNIDFVESGTGSNAGHLIQDDGAKAFIETFSPSSTYEPIRGGIIDSSATTDDLICSISSNGGGNSLIFDWQFDSNTYVGEYRDTINSVVLGDQIARNYASYTDNLGKMETFDLYLFNTLTTNLIEEEEILAYADNLPITNKSYIDTSYIKNNTDYSFYVVKDAREEIGGTIQLKAYTSDANNKILGRWLFRKNRLVNESPPTSIKLYISTTRKLSRTENFKLPSSGYTELTSPTISVDSNNYKITVSHSSLDSDVVSWVLTDENDFILVGCNQSGTLLNTIVFNFTNKKVGIGYQGFQIERYNLFASAIDLSSISGTATLLYTLRYITANAPSLSSISGTAEIVYTSRIYSLQANATNLSSISGTAAIEYIVRDYLLNATSTGLSTISGTASITMTLIDYVLQAYASSLSSISGTASIEMTSLTYYLEANASGLSSISGTASITLTSPTYTVNFYDWNNYLLSTQQVDYGDDATPPNNPQRDYYIFTGWSPSYTNITSNKDIYAQYTIKSYTVTFINDGVTYDTQTVQAFQSATTPSPNPTKASTWEFDYTFTGWNNDYSYITANISTYAQYTAVVRTDVEWVEITSGTPTTGQTCNNVYDLNNIITTTQPTCAFEADGSAYQTSENETTTIPVCSDGATYTFCVKISTTPLLFSCTDYVGVEGADETIYYECQME